MWLGKSPAPFMYLRQDKRGEMKFLGNDETSGLRKRVQGEESLHFIRYFLPIEAYRKIQINTTSISIETAPSSSYALIPRKYQCKIVFQTNVI